MLTGWSPRPWSRRGPRTAILQRLSPPAAITMTHLFLPAALPCSRRSAVTALAAMCAGMLLPGGVRAGTGPAHPTPREGITSAAVLDPATVSGRARLGYQAAREIPQVLDGLYCHCDCAERDGLRSLLSCFETRMPTSCGICVGEARLALRLHRKGDTLAQIRRAVDEEYG